MLLEPKEILVKTLAGDEKTYIISKFPAIAGREIFAQYPFSMLPRIGDYPLNEQLMLKIMAFVAVPGANPDQPLRLSSRALVDNHVPDWETLARLELSVMNYNCSFFENGRASTFLSGLGATASTKITAMLTDLLAKLSQAAGQPSTTSKPGTRSRKR